MKPGDPILNTNGLTVCVKIWGDLLPDKYGGDQQFYRELSNHYEDSDYLADQEATEGENGYDDGSVQMGIDKALDFLERHEEDNK